MLKRHEQRNTGKINSHIKFFRKFRKHRLGMASLVFLMIILAVVLLAPVIAPHDPNMIVGPYSDPPSFKFLLGTDRVGRDLLSRLIYGTRTSLLVGFLVAFLSTTIGIFLGLFAGYFGKKWDIVIMGFTDMVMSFPYMLLVLVAAAIFSPGLWTTVLILGFVNWPGVARIVRGNVLSLREQNFTKAAQLLGMPRKYILFSEILPNTIAPLLVYTTSVVAYSILDEAALSFLGMGVQSPTSSLGNMLNGAESLTVLTEKIWLWAPPGIVIVLLVLAINFIGDALRDALDPNSR